MKLLRLIILAATILISAAYAFAQQPVCTQKRAPEYKGFQLGMTMMDVKDKMADPSTFDSKLSAVNKINSQAIQLLASELKDESAEAIESVNLTFVDKRLSAIKVTYNGSDSWMGAQDFFKQTSEKLGVPAPSASSSTTRGRGGERARVDCTGFAVMLAYSFGVSPNVTIYDAATLKLVDERSEKNPDGEVKTINIGPSVPVRRQP
jgi:ABC-type transporter Mla MlaB component